MSPPPEESDWAELAGWAAQAYRELGFAPDVGVPDVALVAEGESGTWLEEEARELALEVLEVGPRSRTETRWILLRALGRPAQESPRAQVEHEATKMMRSTPLWYDRRNRAIRIIEQHPLLAEPPRVAQFERWHLMAHEVAHALQDLRGSMLEHPATASTLEQGNARRCLLEGEADLRMLALAMRVEGRDLATMESGDCMEELERLFNRRDPSFYDVGFAYLLEELKSGGWEAVERAVATSQISTRDLLSGAGATDSGVEVTLPEWPELGEVEYEWEDVIGAWGLYDLLGSSLPSGQDLSPLADAVLRWKGDRLAVARRADGVTATLWRVVFEDERSARQVAPFLAGAEATVSREGAVLDLAWSPVPSIQRDLLEALERHAAPR